MDPGAEAQAVKRVDRIGQTRPTCVHRFVVEGTVEEHIHSLYANRVAAACDAGGVHTTGEGSTRGRAVGEQSAGAVSRLVAE